MISQNYSESLLMGIQTIRNHWKSIFMDYCRHILGDSRTGVKKPGGKSNSESFRISGSDNWSGFKPFLLSIYTTLYHIYIYIYGLKPYTIYDFNAILTIYTMVIPWCIWLILHYYTRWYRYYTIYQLYIPSGNLT